MNLADRRFVFLGLFSLIGLIYIVRLFYLQIIDDSYLLLAEGNAIRKTTLFPARGQVFDRNKTLIIGNTPVYDVRVVPEQIETDMDTSELCRLLNIDTSYFSERLRELWKNPYLRRKSSTLVDQLESNEIAAFQERLFDFPGFFVQARTIRHYPFQNAAHVFGYIGEVGPKQIEESDGYYASGDYIGISGLELSYEENLRGRRGVRRQYVDAFNRVKGSYKDGRYDTAAISGTDMIIGLDIKLQAYAEQLMQNKKGAIVAIEPSSGEVLCLLSCPSYEPTVLTGRKRNFFIDTLKRDSLKPLFNRALMSGQAPPGSTIKPVQALVGLQMGAVRPSSTFSCNYGYRLTATKRVGCHAHKSPLQLRYSIVTSCNAYYCNVHRKVFSLHESSSEAISRWGSYLNSFGLGIRTGIDLPGETRGIIPTPDYYDRFYGEGRWKASTVISLAIGQGRMGASPLQLANMAATIANRGYYVPPHLIKSYGDGSQLDSFYTRPKKVQIEMAHFDFVVEAMNGVINEGTGRIGRIEGLQFCGKTGTAQNPHGEDHSVFIAFAPMQNPEIALCVYVENGGFGSTYAAPIASLLVEKYLHDSISNNRLWLEQRMLEKNLIALPNE